MLLLDIGGSYVKYALADMDGRLKEETVGQTPAHADGSFEEICGVLLSVLESARRRQDVGRVCISIPGPFDFESGISHMQHKFPSLLGRSLRAPFEQEHAAGQQIALLRHARNRTRVRHDAGRKGLRQCFPHTGVHALESPLEVRNLRGRSLHTRHMRTVSESAFRPGNRRACAAGGSAGCLRF